MALLVVLAVLPHIGGVAPGGWTGALCCVGWIALVGWQAVSVWWADEPSAALSAARLTLLYGVAFILVMLGLRRASWLRGVSDGVLTLSALVAGYASLARLLPDRISGDEEARLSLPISYWNGLGALVAFGFVVALATAADRARGFTVRAAAGSLIPLLSLTLLFTLSRGAMLAGLVGVAALVALAPGRIETAVVLVTTGLLSIPLLASANGEEGLVALRGTLPPHADEGRRVLVLLLVTMAASAVVTLAVAAGLGRLPRRHRRLAGITVGAIAVVALLTVVIARPPEGGPVRWADRQFESFRTYNPGARTEGSIADRLAVAAGSGRWQQWEVAAGQWSSAPVVGTGAGDYRFVWNRDRPIDQTVQNAHSLYLEVLGESGLVGLLLLVVAPGVAIITIGRVLVSRAAAERERRDIAAACAACLVIGVHLAGDWNWQLPAVTLPAIVLGAAATRAALHLRAPRASAWGAPAAWAITALSLAAFLAVAGPTLSARDLSEARRLAQDGDLRGALVAADRALERDPASPAPYLLRANLLADLDRPIAADRAFAQARERSPRDWVILADWAAALAARGDLQGARRAVGAAVALNPREGRLLQLRDALTS
ncbi:MAG: O-antigen ligase family protein [Dehalococcoidia bacterium]